MNHSTLTREQLATQFTLQPVVAQDDRTPRQRFQDGFDAYCGGLSIFEIYDPDEQRGWWAANSAESEAGVPGYADSLGW